MGNGIKPRAQRRHTHTAAPQVHHGHGCAQRGTPGAHHHGPVESVIYVVSGKARMRWGDQLEFTAEAGPGDFIHVPPYVPHQEINASDTEPLSCVLCRSGQDPVVVNLDIPVIEQPETVRWLDDIHRAP